ncbi:hypothetical protein [Nocardia sp. NBC_01009]|nr:hypothetical protein OHA42_12710 [Nocardia sp. NBC_01009]
MTLWTPVAERPAMSPRTLQCPFAEHDTIWRAEVEQVRQENER